MPLMAAEIGCDTVAVRTGRRRTGRYRQLTIAAACSHTGKTSLGGANCPSPPKSASSSGDDIFPKARGFARVILKCPRCSVPVPEDAVACLACELRFAVLTQIGGTWSKAPQPTVVGG